MFADAVAYGIALAAINRGLAFKARAAATSGSLLLVLGIGVLIDTVRRAVFGSAPESHIIMAVASVSLVVNATVLYFLGADDQINKAKVRKPNNHARENDREVGDYVHFCENPRGTEMHSFFAIGA